MQQGRHIPLPSSTPFDANVFARQAYLDGYRVGYNAVISGQTWLTDTLPGGAFSSARRLGFYAGAGQARYDAEHHAAQIAPEQK